MNETELFKIIISVETYNFTLIFDEVETYYLFYDNELINTMNDAITPKELYKLTSKEVYSNIQQMDNEVIKVLTNELDNRLEKPFEKASTLKSLISTLKDAYKDKDYYIQYIKGASSEIQNFIIDLSDKCGFDNPLKDNDLNIGDETDFNKIFEKYNSCIPMLETELYDYVDNTENIFKGIINSLCALLGYGSRFIIVNGGSEVGKTEYIKTIKKMMPNFMNLGSSTPASIRRKPTDEFNKKIVYLGDKGLKGINDEEFKGLLEVFGGLITDKEFIREIVVGDKIMGFELKSDGVCAFITQPYTNLRMFDAGDQYITRSTFVTINPVKDGLSVFLQDENNINKFYDIHKNYIKYILENPIDLKISDDVKTKIYQSCRESLRTARYILGLFKAYCQYIQLGNPLTTDVEKFLKIFNPYLEITDIEFLIYSKLYKNLKVLSDNELEFKIDENGYVLDYNDILTQNKKRKDRSFFTAKQIKTYFKNDFKKNKNLKDTIDQIPAILNNLYNAGYIERLDWQYNGQNVYYIPFNMEMEK